MHKHYEFGKKPKYSKFRRILSSMLLSLIIIGQTSYFFINETNDKGIQITKDISAKKNISSEANNKTLILNSRLVRLEGEINSKSAKNINREMLNFYMDDEKTPIYFLINSPGGSVMAGRQIIDIMEMVKAPIYCQVVGMSASMAALITMHCDKKFMTPASFLLFHQMSIRLQEYTQIREVEADIKFWKKYWEELMRSTAKKMNMSYEEFYNKNTNTWMLTAQQAKDAGYIDGILTEIECEKQFGKCRQELYPSTIPFLIE